MFIKQLMHRDPPSREYELNAWNARVKRRLWWRRWTHRGGYALLFVSLIGSALACPISAYYRGADDRLTLALAGLALASFGLRRVLREDPADRLTVWTSRVILFAAIALALSSIAQVALDHVSVH